MMVTKRNGCFAPRPTGNRNARSAVACLPLSGAPVFVKRSCNGYPWNKRISHNSFDTLNATGSAFLTGISPTGVPEKSVKREIGSVLAGAAAAEVRCISSRSAHNNF